MEHYYTDKLVTACGGMKEMKMLIDKTGISKKLSTLGLPEGKSNNSIDSVSIIESFWVSIWIGCFRFSHTAVVIVDEVLREIFGWKRVASGTTFGRFFLRSSHPLCTTNFSLSCILGFLSNCSLIITPYM